MDKRLKRVILSGLVILSLIGFTIYGSNSPKGVVRSLERAIKKGDFKELNSLLSEPSEFTEDEKEVYDEYSELYADAFKELDINVTNEVIDGDTATVNCIITGPNLIKEFPNIMTELLSGAIAQQLSGRAVSEEYIVESLYDKLSKSPVDDREGYLTLVKNDDEWKLNSNDEIGLITTILGGRLPYVD